MNRYVFVILKAPGKRRATKGAHEGGRRRKACNRHQMRDGGQLLSRYGGAGDIALSGPRGKTEEGGLGHCRHGRLALPRPVGNTAKKLHHAGIQGTSFHRSTEG